MAQTIRVTNALSMETVKFMISRGLSKHWVLKQLRLYRRALAEGGDKLRNTQLPHRKALMERILELWPD